MQKLLKGQGKVQVVTAEAAPVAAAVAPVAQTPRVAAAAEALLARVDDVVAEQPKAQKAPLSTKQKAILEAMLGDLKDLTDTRVMLETEALRQSIRLGDARWESDLAQAFAALTEAEQQPGGLEPLRWEAANKRFHEALISAHRSPWSKHLLGILYRHGERYRQVAIRMGATQAVHRDVHEEHPSIYTAAMARQEARAALALEAHIRLTCDILLQQAANRPPEARQAAG